jgi:hypothetical protein
MAPVPIFDHKWDESLKCSATMTLVIALRIKNNATDRQGRARKVLFTYATT